MFAFYQTRDGLKNKWELIPDDTDVLITHTPPIGILDKSSRGRTLGCPILKERVLSIAPAVHCFGHVHASDGKESLENTRFVNASSFIKQDRPLRSPISLNLNQSEN
jgi:Icc-related predicted phosphoesterase